MTNRDPEEAVSVHAAAENGYPSRRDARSWMPSAPRPGTPRFHLVSRPQVRPRLAPLVRAVSPSRSHGGGPMRAGRVASATGHDGTTELRTIQVRSTRASRVCFESVGRMVGYGTTLSS